MVKDNTPARTNEEPSARTRRGTLVIEHQTIAVGWSDPVALHNAGHTHGVTGAMFFDKLCGHIYAYLVACAGRVREPSAEEYSDLAGEHGVPAEYGDLHDILATELDGTPVDVLVEGVAFDHQRRSGKMDSQGSDDE